MATNRIRCGPWRSIVTKDRRLLGTCTLKMQFLLGFLTLISLADVIFGDIKIEEDHGLARGYVSRY